MKLNRLIFGLLCVIGIALIILVLPTENKFRFEFQKGQQWMHEDLFAPFDFSIYKTQDEIKRETDSLKKSFIPFFTRNNEIAEIKKDQLLTRFYILKNKSLPENKKFEIGDKKVPDYKYLKQGLVFLSNVYSRGIIHIGDNYEDNFKELIILEGKHAVHTKLSSLYTKESSKQAFEKFIADYISQTADTGILILKSINFYNYFEPNIHYDLETTEQMKSNLLSTISYTRGKIGVGELIISTGDYVNSEKYRVLSSLKKEINSRTISTYSFYMILGGQIVLVLLSFFALILLIYYSQPEILTNNKQASFIIMIVVIFVAFAGLSARYYFVNIYLIPFAMIPVIIKAFFNERIALFTFIITILISAFNAPNSFEFVFIQIIVGVIILFSLGDSYRRSYLFLASIISFCAYCIIYFGIAVTQEGEIGKIYWKQFAWFGSSSILLLTTYPLIFVFEKIFGFLSDMTLIELSDTNSPLLRELAEKAPGTFQHTLQVANLAEAAAREVGANALLARVGALYHDIGKIKRPLFFTENQSNNINPHESLKPIESAEIIIGHVTDGIKISRKYKLPEQIVSFIKGHHGTTNVQYFLNKQEQISSPDSIDHSRFTYPIEKPQMKEVAIMMMADVVEAASRSLSNYDEKSITILID